MIYDRIKDLCSSHGETITGLEKKLGFARGSLSKIDRFKPSSERVQKIADHFGVTPTYILTGESSEEYYTNSETAQLAQKILTNPDLRALMQAAEDSTPEDMQMVADILKRMKATNPDG